MASSNLHLAKEHQNIIDFMVKLAPENHLLAGFLHRFMVHTCNFVELALGRSATYDNTLSKIIKKEGEEVKKEAFQKSSKALNSALSALHAQTLAGVSRLAEILLASATKIPEEVTIAFNAGVSEFRQASLKDAGPGSEEYLSQVLNDSHWQDRLRKEIIVNQTYLANRLLGFAKEIHKRFKSITV
jgi:hypothetical protein